MPRPNRASTDPGAPAIIDRRGTTTHGELWEAVGHVRGGLVRRGVRLGDAVLVVTDNDCESVIAYHAVVGLGAVAVLTHRSAGTAERAVALNRARPRLAVVSPAALGETLGAEDIARFTVGDLGDGPPADAIEAPPGAARVVVFTSGTTSTPKGVIHSTSSLASSVANFRTVTALTASDRLFVVSPLGSITGVLQAVELAPAVGAAAVLESSFDDDRSLDFLIQSGATFYGGPDLLVDRLLRAADRRSLPVPLRTAALGGTVLRAELIETAERFGIRVVRVYGSSEVPCSAGTRPNEPATQRLSGEGLPAPGVELRLSDDGLDELLVRGPHCFSGYLDPADDVGALDDGWFHTGDAAEIVGGRLRIVGRLKEIVIRNGKKISLAEVDHAFTAASGIEECAAFGVADAATGERVAMAVRMSDSARTLDVTATLSAMQAAGLARWKLPESIVGLTDALPTTASGKVMRRALTEASTVLWQAPRLIHPEL